VNIFVESMFVASCGAAAPLYLEHMMMGCVDSQLVELHHGTLC